MADWRTVRKIAGSFPEAEASLEGRPAWRVRGKLFAWRARDRDGRGLAVRVDRDDKELFLDAKPDVYYTTPHYNGYPAVIITLAAIERDELFERLEDAWLIQAPKRLAAEYMAAHDQG